jgi:hypothetical protein
VEVQDNKTSKPHPTGFEHPWNNIHPTGFEHLWDNIHPMGFEHPWDNIRFFLVQHLILGIL